MGTIIFVIVAVAVLWAIVVMEKQRRPQRGTVRYEQLKDERRRRGTGGGDSGGDSGFDGGGDSGGGDSGGGD